MSIIDTARTIARRDADDRAAHATTRQEANALLQQARDTHDQILEEAVRRRIATEWPTRKPTDFKALLEQTNAKLVGIVEQARKDATLTALEDNLRARRINDTYFKEQKEIVAYMWATEIEDIEESADDLVNKATGRVRQIFNRITEPAGDTNAQLLAELRQGKAWERLKTELDLLETGQLMQSILEVTEAATDNPTRKMLLDEIPTYMKARGIPFTEQDLREALIAADPELKAADDEETRASEYRTIVKFNAQWVRNNIIATNGALNPNAIKYGLQQIFITADRADLKQ